MDKGLVVVAIACIAMLAFFVGYQLFATDQPNVEPVDNGGDVEDDVWDSSMIVNVELKGDSIAVSSSRPAIVNGSRMTIKSAGTYNITGSLADGQIIVYTKDKGVVRLILNGVSINCSTSSPICVLDADEVVLFLEAGTQNFVSDASSYVFDNPTEHEPNAAIFSKSDLTILGNGSLGVVGNYNDGIASKDGLVIRSGIITVRSVDDGIRGKDYLVIKGGNIDLDVGGDGLKSDNAVNSTLGYVSVVDGVISIRSGGDAVQAQTSVLISGGSFNLTSGGGSGGVVVGDVSAKGIKGVVSVVVDGGTFMISSADDAIHSNGNVTINGGIFTLSSGDDAIHADGSVQVNGGDINIVSSFEGVEGAAVAINDGHLRIVSVNDGVDAVLNTTNSNSGVVSVVNGVISIVSGGDAVQAEKDVLIAGGDFVLTSGGGSGNLVAASASAKGIKAVFSVVVNGGTFTINSADDALHSNGTITVNSGSFTLSSGDDTIHADGSVEVNGGDITIVKSFEGVEGAFVTVNDGNMSIVSSDDGIDAAAGAENPNSGVVSVVDGVINIRSGGDAVQAETSVLISGGSFNLTSGGGSGGVVVGDVSAKGIKGVVSVVVDGGTFMISSADDAIHSNGNVTINGGIFTLSSGDDAIHADGSVQVNGGDITIVDSIWVDPGGEPWDSSIVVNVELKGDSITVSHSRPAIVDGSKVIIRSAGTYNITGYLTDGQIIVYTQDAGPVKLILNGVNINCSTSSPICVLDAAEVVMFLPAGTENSVGDGASYVLASPSVDEPNAAVFSKDDLTISGDGLLRVVGNYNDGIASKDGLVIESGTLIVSSVDDGIRGKDYLIVKGGNLDLDVGGDGLKSDNAEDAKLGYVSVENGVIDIKSGGDAFQAETRVLITGGSFHLVSGGGSSRTVSGGLSAKGIKGTVGVTIDAGSFVIDSADDAIHSNGNVTINGGSLVLSTGDDGIHADSSIKINNGEIKITKSYEGIESDVVTINGGNIHVVSRDDGVNVGPDSGFFPGGGSTYSGSYYLYVNGGYLAVNALGDGIDSNGAIVMTGGYVIVDGPSDDMNGALDHVACNVTGGFLLAVGSSGMAQAPGPLSTQYSVLLNFRSRYQAGTLIHVQASDGTEVFTFLPTKQFQSVAFSLPSLARGITYDVYVGGSYSGTVNDGLCSGGTYTPGSKYTSFTISSIVTQIGSGGGFFPGF